MSVQRKLCGAKVFQACFRASLRGWRHGGRGVLWSARGSCRPGVPCLFIPSELGKFNGQTTPMFCPKQSSVCDHLCDMFATTCWQGRTTKRSVLKLLKEKEKKRAMATNSKSHKLINTQMWCVTSGKPGPAPGRAEEVTSRTGVTPKTFVRARFGGLTAAPGAFNSDWHSRSHWL